MKNKITTLAITLFAIANTIAQERIITENQLPKPIKTYIKKHFPNEKVVKIEKEKKSNYTSYDVDLTSVNLDFKGNSIKEIEGNKKLPNSVIPANIRKYVTNRYPNHHIISWKLSSNNKYQEIELNDETELIFDRKGKFIRLSN